MGLFGSECGVCGYRTRYCTCVGRRASGDQLKDQMSPLTEPRRSRSRRADDKASRER